MNDDFTAAHDDPIKDGLRKAISADDERPSLPFEHGGTLLASLGFALCGLKSTGRSSTLLHGMIAGALLWRSLSGRDGLRRWVDAPANPPAALPATTDAVSQSPSGGGPL